MRAGTWDLIQGFGFNAGDTPDELSHDVYWALAIVRLGLPLSFSRATMTSVTKDLTQGALLRADRPLVMTDDILQMTVQGQKGNHKKSLTAHLKQTDTNFLVEIYPGDWVMAWITNNKTDIDDVIQRINQGKACNRFMDGLKFVGRVSSIRKVMHVDAEVGYKTAAYNLACTGFEELDTNFYYDNSLASKDVLEKDIGQWLTRLGVAFEKLFANDTNNALKTNNVNKIVPTLLDLIVGKGPKPIGGGEISIDAADGHTIGASPQISQTAPYSYMIPAMIGQLLGRTAADASKHVLGYCDIMELLIGVQSYSNKNGPGMFVPDLRSESTPQRRICNADLMGTFLPYMPDMANKPLFAVLSQYLNPTINEMYTAMRVNADGNVVPTLVMRQIPFTTDAFQQSGSLGPDEEGPPVSKDDSRNINITRFLDLPRWFAPNVIINGDVDLGRSDATRINFVHVYGTSSYQNNAISVQEQIVNNPPVMDHLDIMRSGMRPYMATVECWVDDTVGKAPRAWMNLVADWTIGSQYTLNGSIETYGIQEPICEGDNLEFDGVVYHLEGVTHTVRIAPDGGKKTWRTQLMLTNGMRKDAPGAMRSDTGDYPIYPGLEITDNTANDPGLSLEQTRTTGGVSRRTAPADDAQPGYSSTANINTTETTLNPNNSDDKALLDLL